MADHIPGPPAPLARFARPLADVSIQSGGSLSLREEPFASQLTVRAVAGTGRPALPAVNAVGGFGDGYLLGLGPDEWLAIGAPDTAGRLEADLRAWLGPWLGAVVDVSAQRTTLVASGPSVRDLLARGCALDLDPGSFGVGRCAQTMLAHAQVVLYRSGPDEFRLLVRPSFAAYLTTWLLDAASDLPPP